MKTQLYGRLLLLFLPLLLSACAVFRPATPTAVPTGTAIPTAEPTATSTTNNNQKQIVINAPTTGAAVQRIRELGAF